MLVIEDIVCDNNLTQKEILERCIVDYTDEYDALDVAKILHNNFKIPSYDEALKYMTNINADLENSVKFFDPETGEVYGLLLVADNDIKNGIPHIDPIISGLFRSLKQKEGVAFILDKRIRGMGIDRCMMQTYKDSDDYQEQDLMWCGVQHELKSHNYWLKNGFINFYSDFMAEFYFKLTD